MDNPTNKSNFSCNSICWLFAVVFGILVAAWLQNKLDWHWLVVLVVGLIAVLGGGWVLTGFLCDGLVDKATTDGDSGSIEAAKMPVGIADIGEAASVSDDSHSADPVSSENLATENTKLDQNDSDGALDARGKSAGEKSIGGKNTSNKDDGDTNASGNDDGDKQVDAAEKPEEKQTKPVADAPEETGNELPAGMVAAADGKPALFEKAPERVDDLKKIKGVGPGLESTLNALGIYTFAQIAQWKAKDIAWVDGNLKFKGRIKRDDWVKQSKKLSTGGETDFSKRVDKGGVY